MAELNEVLDGIKELVDHVELEVQRVDSAELLNETFRLRYQVYCNECNFINPKKCTDGMEKDKYDPYAVHFSASDKHGVIGTMRLVTDSPHGFPLEEYCQGNLYVDIDKISRKETAEISRLVISKRLRRRLASGPGLLPELSADNDRTGIGRFVCRCKPIALGMYREMYYETKSRGIKYWYALMEKPLFMLLRLYGFQFKPIGKEVDVCGIVKPYLASVEDIEKTLREQFPIFMRNGRHG